jgi:Zn-dependent M28 family amino/carboxypeptidase
MKSFFYFIASFLIFAGGCTSTEPVDIDSKNLLKTVQIISHDSLEGRAFSTLGNIKAQKIINRNFTKIGLQTGKNRRYFQEFSYSFKGEKRQEIFPIKKPKENFSNVPDTTLTGRNIVGTLKGKINKSIIITAHFDHLGIKNGNIYNGADDNASGVAALFTIAEYFKKNPTNHDLIFAAFDAKEFGSLGAEYFLKNYEDKENIVLNINLDMIAHSDYDPILFACGLHHHPNLRKPLERIKSDEVTLLFGHDDPLNRDQTDWTFSSDHKVFHKENIPFIYFGVESHKDYHRHTDNYETINPEFYIETVKIIIQAIKNFDEFLLD